MREAIDFYHLAKGVVSMRMLPVAMIPALLLASSICAASECGRDTDCKGDRVCYQGRCVNPDTADVLEAKEVEEISEEGEPDPEAAPESEVVTGAAPGSERPEVEATPPAGGQIVQAVPETAAFVPAESGPFASGLKVLLDPRYHDAKGVMVYLDGVEVGEAPWEGSVEAGTHEVRLEGGGYYSRAKFTKVWPDKTSILQLRLIPREGFDVGRVYVGVMYSGGVGTAFHDGEYRPAGMTGWGPGGVLGVKIDLDRGWWEIGALIGPYHVLETYNSMFEAPPREETEGEVLYQNVTDPYASWGLPMALQVRGVIPLKTPFVYWGVEGAVGGVISETGGFTALMRTGPAFILGPWVEVRLDLVGAQLLAVKYELEAYYQIEYSSTDHDNEYRTYKENIVAFMYSPSISLVLRI